MEEDLEEEIVEKDIEATKKQDTDDIAGLKRTDVPRKSSFISSAGNRRCLDRFISLIESKMFLGDPVFSLMIMQL